MPRSFLGLAHEQFAPEDVLRQAVEGVTPPARRSRPALIAQPGLR